MESAVIIKVLCANRGAMDCDDLLVNSGFNVLNLNGASEKFHIAVLSGKTVAIARTRVKLCKARDCDSCNNLHLCKFYLYGDCRNSRGRRRCRFCHDLNSEHNAAVLRSHDLQDLEREELCTLLLQNDSTLLPPVCVSYNEGSGQFGRCPEQENCRRLHICDKYIRGTCGAGADCPRAHDFFEPHPLNTLRERGIPNKLMASMFSVYQNIQAMKKSDGQPGSGPRTRPEKTEICIYFVKGGCKHGAHCRKEHFRLPYKWEVKRNQGWALLTDSEEVEKAFCDPANTHSQGVEPVCFDTMTQGMHQVRRLSTVSSVLQPNFILTMEWAWYWEDEFGAWIQYASSNEGHSASSISSEDLERRYQEDSGAVVRFTAGSQTYELSFQDMIQTNIRYSTKKLVRRRPVFVSSAEVQKIKTSKRIFNKQSNFKALPEHWDKSLVPETGYKKVTLSNFMSEYKDILGLFRKTMLGFSVRLIERVQNRALWEVFQWQRDQMEKSKGSKAVEKLLFHGTDSKHVDAICLQNFDWRICGTHGTAFGKGSYFARDAKYSHSYTGSSGMRTMFVCRVLVGDYTKGCSSYVRPPSKDGGDVNFYDSCVDDVYNPSIFVVFEKHQVYPEYLIQYYEDHVASPHPYTYVPPVSRPAPRPAAPAPASYSSTYSSYSSSTVSDSNSSSCVIC
ncbi:protein mono-ADP-ribosyltransferase PARP12-like [Scleropages formosus]|uniref:protein mono-ADP-ribosyltransferase PARP12-like n=1 Tax=Scleropages formosus TaxID=113540 RepID=UPI0008789475|nr:protein mono-ADP-ribosyltransferase PARP12-like [Scleropages formosus]